mmetsp:Transcript_6765/g.8401  ORF Transcript_6765/g.8401 Transcript_6765/m.8401 type:complete len:330 (-) Transcript_6765:83-1072(-)
MHGVKKDLNETVEEKAKKAAALANKISKYQKLLTRLKEKRENKEYDDEALKLTEALLSVNGECYTMWNFRCCTLLSKFDEDVVEGDTEEQSPSALKEAQIAREKKLLNRELNFTQRAITRNPKSYWCWNHREWATQRLSKLSACDWKQEIALCNKLLHYDARNFHCWNYRRYVVRNSSDITNEDELKFTTNLIEENFSNYSAWHQRSKLLPLIYTEREEYLAAISEELEIIKNAFYTMPNDSSAWFYHRWLINENPTKEIIEQELKGLEELMEILETDEEKKWPQLTMVFLLRHLNEQDPRVKDLLAQLTQVDPKRKAYYHSLQAQISQ